MSTFASSSCPGFIHPFVLARSRQSGTTFPSLYCPARPLSALLKLSPSNASPEKHLSPGRPLRSLCALALALLLQPAVAANAKNLLTENTIFRRYLVTDSAAILRYTLPLPSERLRDPSPAPIRLVQEQLERLGVHLRARGVAGIIAGRRDVEDVQRILSQRQLDILLDVPASGRQAAAEKLTKLEVAVADIGYELGTSAPVVGQTLFPRDVVRVEQTLRDALTPRNTLKSIANYDSMFSSSLYVLSITEIDSSSSNSLLFLRFINSDLHFSKVLTLKRYARLLFKAFQILKKLQLKGLVYHFVFRAAITGMSFNLFILRTGLSLGDFYVQTYSV